MLGGYKHRILRVDLTNKKTWVEVFEEDVLRKFIGGSGLAAKIIADEVPPDADPLGPDNHLIFMTGPFTGTQVLNSGRHAIVAKSPLTGIWGESDVGGQWGTMLKKCGYDGIVFMGQSASPVYLWIHDLEVEIRDASHLWGVGTFETAKLIAAETHPKANTTCIGVGGENLVNLSCIISDGNDARAGGRCGLGAVMGSKKLKAIAVYGTGVAAVAVDRKGVIQLNKKVAETMIPKTRGMHDNGTAGGLINFHIAGGLPIKNWAKGEWEEGAMKITGVTMTQTILKKNYHCSSCIIGCGRVTEVKEGPFQLPETAGPEYETLALFGSNLLIDNLEAINYANYLCNDYGIDTIGVGGAIAFAMECYEHNLINRADCCGEEILWGDPATLIRLVKQIAHRQGIGGLLGQGVRAAAAAIGGGSEEYAIHVKGMELPAHDPRAWVSVGLAYATSNRGACHLQACSQNWEKSITTPSLGFDKVLDRFSGENKGHLVFIAQNLMCIMDSLKLCKFSTFGGIDAVTIAKWLNLVTGWDFTLEEMMKAGERMFTLKRMFNNGCGITKADDNLPKRIQFKPRGDGPNPDHLPPLKQMLEEYYQYRRWDENGFPTDELIEDMGLEGYKWLLEVGRCNKA
jgi:aldehyde:ferredoxin oxidoreductase